MTRSTKFVLGSWVIGASALAGCINEEQQGKVSATEASGGAITSVSAGGDTDIGDTSGDDSSAVPPGGTAGGGSGAATSGMDTSMPGGTGGTGDSAGTGGVDDPTGGGAALGCNKVDLLFVIDNAGTMKAEQEALIAAFPAFYDGIKATLGVSDYHVMAVAADDGMTLGYNSICQGDACHCNPAPNCCTGVCGGGFAGSCNGTPCDTLAISECSTQFGAGRDVDFMGKACMLADGRRYMTAAQMDVPGTFACIAGVGTYDTITDKKPMQAATAATSMEMNAVGGCDEGFLRDDALLVLVFISDKDDDNDQGTGSPGAPQEWYDAIVAAKKGNNAGVVTLGLVGDGNMNGGACDLEDEPDMQALAGSPAPRLQEFVGMFPHGLIGSVCAPDYVPFLTSAVPVIDQACDALPPGV